MIGRKFKFYYTDLTRVQVGSWWYNKDKKLDAHIHKDFDRTASRTMEMTYIKQFNEGDLYDENQISFDLLFKKR